MYRREVDRLNRIGINESKSWLSLERGKSRK